MNRRISRLAVWTAFAASAWTPPMLAQAPAQTPTMLAAPTANVSEDNLLPGFPRPSDTPASLFQPAAAKAPYSCAPLPGPYFERDPRLDPPPLPQPGWFAAVELGIVGPHVKNRLIETVQAGSRPPDTVFLPSASLDWTVSPRIDLGYRLPSGFGGFAVAYQNLATNGTDSIQGPDGPATLRSRLDVNRGLLDYQSWEMSFPRWPEWGMKWWFGLEIANVFFDSQLNEAFTDAAAGSGIFATHVANHYLGGGPNYGLEIVRHWQATGLAFMARVDSAIFLGRVEQDFLEISTSSNGSGSLLSGQTRRANPQAVPMLNGFVGLTWQPPRYPYFDFSFGYEIEYWWNVGRLSTGASRGEWGEQGVLLRAGFNF